MAIGVALIGPDRAAYSASSSLSSPGAGLRDTIHLTVDSFGELITSSTMTVGDDPKQTDHDLLEVLLPDGMALSPWFLFQSEQAQVSGPVGIGPAPKLSCHPLEPPAAA